MPGVNRLAADKHVMAPDQKTEHGDRHARERNERVTEDLLSRETGDQFADHAHAGQNHDVNGRMRVEPEEVLEQNRIAAVAPDRKFRTPEIVRTDIASVIASTGVPEP